ncbi:MAG: glucose-6-phosphate isomerase [Xylanivirga thermophila]|jgi:UDP-2-acetamido-2,6-beta-L-arabino-hexul-4-ose reductase|uniref:polysaccharide biosynthesis C-terminal domain-containing protein n=1 Tax=Xylanivirga thermophila TaxID=2496273 RepID=UPI0039F481FA
MKTVLITGSNGFLGQNLVSTLKTLKNIEILQYDKNNSIDELKEFIFRTGFIFHLAGINRPKDIDEYEKGNKNFTENLINILRTSNKSIPVLISSSIQAELNNPYGISKKAAEDALFKYQKETGARVLVYRLPNLFGKWSKPNYNSVVATFCYNIARNLDIQINNPETELNLCYIDDVVKEFIKAMEGNPTVDGKFCMVPNTYNIKLGKLADLIKEFKKSRENLSIPDMRDPFIKKLYSTYLSYLPEDDFSYKLKMHCDNRGSFTEFIRTPERGQVSVNISKPGITKGNHWHHTKNEKFLVVSGNGLIKFRNINLDNIIEYKVSGERLEVVDIPPGYTHSITNLGDTDMITIMWANECFDQEDPDTYYLEV